MLVILVTFDNLIFYSEFYSGPGITEGELRQVVGSVDELTRLLPDGVSCSDVCEGLVSWKVDFIWRLKKS